MRRRARTFLGRIVMGIWLLLPLLPVIGILGSRLIGTR